MVAITHGITTTSTANATSYASGAFTPAADDLLVVFVGATSSDAPTPTLVSSVAGKTFSLIQFTVFTGGEWAFVADQLASNESQTVTFDCTGFGATGCTINVERISGVTKVGADAILQTAEVSNGSAATTPETVFAGACQTGNPTLVGLIKDLTTEVTVPTSWPALGSSTHGFPGTSNQTVGRDSGFTGTTITWGGTSDGTYSVLAIEIDASGEGGGGRAVGAGLLTGSKLSRTSRVR